MWLASQHGVRRKGLTYLFCIQLVITTWQECSVTGPVSDHGHIISVIFHDM